MTQEVKNTWGRTLTAPDPQYTITKKIGEGAYGIVSECISTEGKRAIKITELDKWDSSKNEAKIMSRLHHRNIIQVHDFYIYPEAQQQSWAKVKFALIMDLASTDVRKMCRSRLNKITDDHVGCIMAQIFKGLKYIHGEGIIHRDLAANNILVNNNCHVSISDFGMALEAKGDVAHTTREITCRWYRAPEILYDTPTYNNAIDIWSAGCIMGELLTGLNSEDGRSHRALFQGGDDIEQVRLIATCLGTPTPEAWPGVNELHHYKYWIREKIEPKSWPSIFPRCGAAALDLLDKLLVYDPAKRLTAAEALEHPYCKRWC